MQRIITRKNVADFKLMLQNDEKSKNTIEKYIRDIGKFVEYVGDREVEKTIVLEYKSKLAEIYALSSANSMVAAINTFLKFLGWYDCCVKQFKLQKQIYCSENKELTKSEYFSLVRAAKSKNNDRLSLLIQTICSTGIRVGEVQYITVEALYTGEVMVSCKGKTRKVFIVPELCKKLRQYVKKKNITKGSVFTTKNGKPLNRSNVWREMKMLCEDAGVSKSKVYPHNLRHLFARIFYNIEKDIAKLADILGHSNVDTTRIYIMTTGEEHRRKMENMQLVI